MEIFGAEPVERDEETGEEAEAGPASMLLLSAAMLHLATEFQGLSFSHFMLLLSAAMLHLARVKREV